MSLGYGVRVKLQFDTEHFTQKQERKEGRGKILNL